MSNEDTAERQPAVVGSQSVRPLKKSAKLQAARDSWRKNKASKGSDAKSRIQSAKSRATRQRGYGAVSTQDDEESDEEDPEVLRLKEKIEDFCDKDPDLRPFAEEIHGLQHATPKQLRRLYNLFLEPLHEVNRALKLAHKLDKFLSLLIMVLGSVMPMLHMMGVPSSQCAAFGTLIPLLQGINMNLAPHKRVLQLEQVRDNCCSEAHHFLTATGEYHDFEDEETGQYDFAAAIKHFLEHIEHHFAAKKGKPKKKDKKKDKEKK